MVAATLLFARQGFRRKCLGVLPHQTGDRLDERRFAVRPQAVVEHESLLGQPGKAEAVPALKESAIFFFGWQRANERNKFRALGLRVVIAGITFVM